MSIHQRIYLLWSIYIIYLGLLALSLKKNIIDTVWKRGAI